MRLNKNYENLKADYLFANINSKVEEYKERNPENKIIKLGIGDVKLPLVPAVILALKKASEEMGYAETFRGYGEYQGCEFLRNAICGYYSDKGIKLDAGEIFISDGAKSDLGNILDIFSQDNTVLIPDPVYPVYTDTNIMAGRNIVFIDGTAENEFLPLPDKNVNADVIYLCSPNNPTGAVYNKEQLKLWVDYANERDAVILFDSAYEAFVSDRDLPSSIFQIEEAKSCAIEFCSLSKTAGFTGTRCGYTVIPDALMRNGESLNRLWLRRQTTKFNGVSYVVQRGAEAVFSADGLTQCKKNIEYYLQNASIISETLHNLNIRHTGGKNSPYIWLECPGGIKSWDYFDYLLNEKQIVGTPGSGFGKNGEGFFRITAFGDRENIAEAMRRLSETGA